MMKILLFFLLSFPILTLAQSATFIADTSTLRQYTGHDQEFFEWVMEFEWRVNHRSLKFGSTLTDVEINKNGPDTILFRISENKAWDTLVTKIPPNSVNRFNYNTCCHYFNAITEEGHIIKGSINFILIDSDKKGKKFLCSIDSYSTFVRPTKAKTISAKWRSPMLPNMYNVVIQEVKKCIWKKCQNTVLLKDDGSENLGYNFKSIRRVMLLHYLPLSAEPIKLIVDVNSGVLIIE